MFDKISMINNARLDYPHSLGSVTPVVYVGVAGSRDSGSLRSHRCHSGAL